MTRSHSDYVQRVLIAVGIVALVVVFLEVVRPLVGVLLLLFGGVLLAVLLDGLARILGRKTPLGHGAALTLVLVTTAVAIVASVWLLGPKVAEQLGELAEQLPETADRVGVWLQQYSWGQAVLANVPDSASGAIPEGRSGFGMVQSAFSTVVGALTNTVIVVFVGIFLAINPALYVDGLVRLVPPRGRKRAEEVFETLGSALRSWLLGRIVSMAIVGVMTAAGLMIAGIPLALTLGLLTALLAFVPYVGSFLAVVIAVAFAAGEGSQAVIHVVIVYAVVQFVESYAITPLVQQKVVSMPPALLITAQVLMGVLAGAVGIAVATPLTVVLVVLAQLLYIEDVLGDDVDVMGADEDKVKSDG